MANPFFSGRIPPDLLERIEQHVSETGESKTQVLINALAAYLNHPVSRPALVSSPGEERFRALEERLTVLEKLFREGGDQTAVIINDNNELPAITTELSTSNKVEINSTHQPDNFDNSSDNVILAPDEFLEDPWRENHDNKNKNTIQLVEEPMKLLAEHTSKKFEALTSSELMQQTGLKQSHLDGYKRRVTAKFKKLEQPLEDKKLLEVPEKIETKQPTIVNGYPYDLFYLGQNEKGKSLWSALPYDNNRYQKLSLHPEMLLESKKDSHQLDNN